MKNFSHSMAKEENGFDDSTGRNMVNESVNLKSTLKVKGTLLKSTEVTWAAISGNE